MVRTQIYLEEEQVRQLRGMAARTGRRRSALIREAIDRLIAEPPGKEDGWADREDLDELIADNRRSVEERLERLWRSS